MTHRRETVSGSKSQHSNDNAPVTLWRLAAGRLRQLDPGLLLAILLSLFAIMPLLAHAGLPNTADGPVHLMRQAELNQAWKDGILYPRWAPDLAYGHGMPLFNYAPPLLYHLSQTLHLTGLALDDSMKGTVMLMMVLHSVGMYLFARDLFGPRAGLLAAAVYLYAPYRLREAFIQGNYGQFCGLAFYPLILWSVYRLATRNQMRYLLLAAISLAGLLLSHNISAMIFAPLLVAYLVFLLVLTTRAPQGSQSGWRKQDAAPSSRTLGAILVRCLAATGMGLGLAAFFWLPAFGERNMIRLSGITSGFFDFRHNFITLAELLALPRPLDLSAINPHYPLSLGVAQVASAALAMLGLVIYAIRDANSRIRAKAGNVSSLAIGHTLFFALAFAAYAFLTLPQSRLVWESVPMLSLAEFPWRLLGPAILSAAVLTGAIIYLLERITLRSNLPGVPNWIAAIGLCLIIAVNLVYLFPVQFIPWGTPTPVDVMAYEIESEAIGTTSTGEFLPRWADRYPSPETLAPPPCTDGGRQTDCRFDQIPSRLDPASLPEGGITGTTSHTARQTLMTVHSPAAFPATFRALYWPGWKVFIRAIQRTPSDGWHQIDDVQITRPDGLIRANLPAGDYQVKLQLSATPIRRAATITSIISLVALGGLGLAAMWHRGKPGRRARASAPAGQHRFPQRPAMAVGVVLVASLLLTRPMASWFQAQSAPGTVQHAQYTSRVSFGNQVQLLAFDLLTCPSWLPGRLCPQPAPDPSPSTGLPRIQVRAGHSLPVVLYWQAVAPLSANYRVFVHLDGLNGQTYASADELNPADIPTSAWPPALYLRNPLTIALPQGLPPIRYTLTTGLYDHHTGTRLPVTGCDGCDTALSGAPGGDAIPDSRAGSDEVSIDALPLAHVWVLPARPMKESDIPHPLNHLLGDDVTLLGYQLEAPPSEPATTGEGDTQLTLYWRTKGPLAISYTVFIHALDADGTILAQFDAPPLDGLYPTDAWLPGQLIADVHPITLPPGTAYLAIGLYDPQSLTRLAIADADGKTLPDNTIHLRVTNDR